jgi:PAS domain S-box-containing protein
MSDAPRDISENKHIGKTLSESERKYKATFESTGTAMFLVDKDAVISDTNRKVEEIFGYTREEVVGKFSYMDFLTPESVELVKEYSLKLLKGEVEGPIQYEVRAKHKTGRIIEALISVNMLPGMDNSVVSFIDITESKQIENLLRESEGKYKATFESTGTAMSIIESDATLSLINQETEKLFGYSKEEVEGKKKYMAFVFPEDNEMVKRISKGLLEGKVKSPVKYECRLVDKSGRIIDALMNVGILPGMNKSVISVIDITEKKNDERILEQRAEQLKDFLDIAAHELRHPATLLKGYALTLNEHWETMKPETLVESLDAMNLGADRLVHVVEELLDMSRLERESHTLVKEEVSLEPLVERAVNEMLVKRGDVEIRFEFRERFDSVYADSESTVRLLIILLDNAVKYSPAGSMVEVVVDKSDNNLLISVLDRGMGVPEDDCESIFERFYQVEDVLHHSIPGLGLGLYIARRTVQELGGKIWYEPRKGGGSVFRFTIPSIHNATP